MDLGDLQMKKALLKFCLVEDLIVNFLMMKLIVLT